MNREVASMVRPGFKRGTWTVYAVSYEIEYKTMAITKVWTHEMRKSRSSTQHRHMSWNPTDIIEGA